MASNYIFSIFVGGLLRLLSTRNPLLNSMALISNISSSSITNPPWRIFITYATLSAYGFIISNFYLALIASILTKSLEGSQINTIQDVLKSAIPILIPRHIKKFLEKSLPIFRFLGPNTITEGKQDFFIKKRDSFNTSYVYPIESDIWKFLNMKQQFFSKPTFSLADVPLIGSYGCFVMRNDSILEQPLKKFILEAYASGLINYWKKESFWISVKGNLSAIVRDSVLCMPLEVGYFLGSFGFLAIGCTLGFLIFIVEIITVYIN